MGHFILRKNLIKNGHLDNLARIIVLTGDIYILTNDSTWDSKYFTSYGGVMAYCQSKLGNIWVALELQKRYPNFTVCIVHPGVISSGLGSTGKIGQWFKSKMMLDTNKGSQTSLFCATQFRIEKGRYYHNAVGAAVFPPGDQALNTEKAGAYYENLDALHFD